MTKSLVSADRKIHFFKILAEGGDKGMFGEKLMAIVEGLDSKERESIYKGNNVNFDIDAKSQRNDIILGQFFHSRDDTPTIRKAGEVSRKKVELQDDEDVNETTHFAYHPKSSYIAVEWNSHGPKIGLITWVVNDLYKKMKIEDKPIKSSYIYLRTGKAYREVIKYENIRSIKAALKDPSTIEDIGTEGDLPQVADQMLKHREERIEITVKSRNRGGILMRIADLKAKYIPTERSVKLYDVFKVAVEDESGKPVEFDLINDKAVAEVTVAKDLDNGGIESSSMYNKLRDELKFAVENYIT